MMKLRTIAHLLELFVIPEVRARIASGVLNEAALPVHVRLFQVVQGVRAGSEAVNTIQINEEVEVVVKAKPTRSVQAGEPLTLSDIDPDDCHIQRPEFEGRPASYFLCQGFLFDYHLIFDCMPGIPDGLADLDDTSVSYPIREFVTAKRYSEAVDPVQWIRQIAAANWPPSPGYVPGAVDAVYADPSVLTRSEFTEKVRACFNQTYWDDRLDFWDEASFFESRIRYIKRAVRAHFEGDHAVSIYMLVPQFEGIIKDYLTSNQIAAPSGFKEMVNALRDLVLSRQLLLFDPDTLEAIFDYLKTGSFWQNSGQVDSSEMVNRHGIAHGAFVDFESQDLSLKYLILLDALAFVLLHDKMLANTI